LFIETHMGTIRMSRFQASFVGRCFHPESLATQIYNESDRIGVYVDPVKMDQCNEQYKGLELLTNPEMDAVFNLYKE